MSRSGLQCFQIEKEKKLPCNVMPWILSGDLWENYDIPIETTLGKTDHACSFPSQQPSVNFIDKNHISIENGSSKNMEQCNILPDTSSAQSCCAFNDDFDEFVAQNYASQEY